MKSGKISLVNGDIISEIDKRLFGSFIEHLGRAVYGGIYEPESESSDENGFRTDVAKLVKDLSVPIVRYPGGNFVSSYFWEDGVGPKNLRKPKLEPAWRSIETNEFGTDEFMEWCKKVDTTPMLAVNLGTRGIQDAINYLEYCNVPNGTYYSEMRKSNGQDEPYNVKTWCLGNEMDGRWQIGYKTAEEYADLAAKTGKAMKSIDPSIELVVCGSTNTSMKWFPEWETTLLDKTYYIADYLSAHIYMGDYTKNIDDYMASTRTMESSICEYLNACDYVKIKQRQTKDMMLSFDEWGVWYHSVEKDKDNIPWQKAPSLLEEAYNFADALAIGAMIIALIRHADRVKIGCLAQLVNVIAPIMTQTNGGIFKQTIYYPYEHALMYAKGQSLRLRFDSPSFTSPTFGENSSLDIAAVTNGNILTFFILNKSQNDAVEVKLDLYAFEVNPEFVEHIVYHSDDPYFVNTMDSQNNIQPSYSEAYNAKDNKVVVQAFSWNVISFKI